MSEPTTEVIAMDAPNTVSVARDLKNELAATVGQWLKKLAEKKKLDKELGGEIKELADRAASLVWEIESGGTQLTMHFGSTEPAEDAEDAEEGEEGEVIEADDDESPEGEDEQ